MAEISMPRHEMQPTKPYLRDLRKAATELLKQPGEWVVAGIDTNIPWPETSQVVEFDGLDFILRASDDKLIPCIILNTRASRLTTKQGQDRILRLASALAWSSGQKLEVTNWLSGSHPFGIGKWAGKVVQSYLSPDNLPAPSDETAWIALALFREGLSINNPFYTFLSFYKTIASIHKDGKARGIWFQKALANLSHDDAKQRLEELQALGTDVSKYLLEEGRHAIAHAEKEVFVNPDSSLDYERIYKDNPIIRNLAELAIQERYGVYSEFASFKKPRSLIAGMEEVLGESVIESIKAEQPVQEIEPFPEKVTLVARRAPATEAFFTLSVLEIYQVETGLLLILGQDEQDIRFKVLFDVATRSIEFEPLRDILRTPAISETLEGVETDITVCKFVWLLFCNGHVELWDDENDKLLGSSSAYMLVNAYINVEGHKADLERLEQKRAALLEQP